MLGWCYVGRSYSALTVGLQHLSVVVVVVDMAWVRKATRSGMAGYKIEEMSNSIYASPQKSIQSCAQKINTSFSSPITRRDARSFFEYDANIQDLHRQPTDHAQVPDVHLRVTLCVSPDHPAFPLLLKYQRQAYTPCCAIQSSSMTIAFCCCGRRFGSGWESNGDRGQQGWFGEDDAVVEDAEARRRVV